MVKMRTFDYILMMCGGLVFSEAAMIITLNTKRGYWEATNKFHVLTALLFLVYLSTVIYSSVECSRSQYYCDLLWKVCSTLYISVNMSVYSFYYAKSRVVNNILTRVNRGRSRTRSLVIISIAIMGICGLSFFWPPIKHVQYYGILIDGECNLADRRWIVITWVCGDTLLSTLLLRLFIAKIEVIKSILGDTPRSVAMLKRMRRMTEKNRNLLLFSLLITIGIYAVIAVLGNLHMRTVIWLCAVDRLVTLQCITMTFTYDGREWFYCSACFILCCQERTSEIGEEEDQRYEAMTQSNSKSTSILLMSSTGYSTVEK